LRLAANHSQLHKPTIQTDFSRRNWGNMWQHCARCLVFKKMS